MAINSRTVLTVSAVSVFVVVLCSAAQLGTVTTKDGSLVQVNDDNWSQILEGEWMVELYDFKLNE